MNKIESIKKSLKETKERRSTLRPVTYQLKIDSSKLNTKSKNQLKLLFIEAKWLYNYLLSLDDMFKYNTKNNNIIIKTKDNTFQPKILTQISSQIKQSIQTNILDSLKGLKILKKHNYKVGKLKFKSEINSINLKQYNVTYKMFKTHNKIKIQGIKQKLHVKGLHQLDKALEFANARLIYKNNNYYLKVTCYEKKKHLENNNKIGIDFGIKDNLTLSNGTTYNIEINQKELNKLSKLNHKFSKKVRKSKNWFKAKLKLNKQYEKVTNIKKDQKNKIVSNIINNYKYVCIQDENIKGWHMGLFGKQVQMSSIGGIISDLKVKSHTPIIINRYFPTTKLCPNCGTKNNITLSDRTYSCKCGYTLNRDIHAAKNILFAGLNLVPMDHRDFKPVEINTSNYTNMITCMYNQVLSKKQEATPFRVW